LVGRTGWKLAASWRGVNEKGGAAELPLSHSSRSLLIRFRTAHASAPHTRPTRPTAARSRCCGWRAGASRRRWRRDARGRAARLSGAIWTSGRWASGP